MTVDGQIVAGDAAATQATLDALNAVLDVGMLRQKDELLILAEDEDGAGAALFVYVNKDGNGKIDAAELAELARFADGVPRQDDIVLVGVEAVVAG